MRPLLLSMGLVVCCTVAVVGSGQPPVLQPPAPAAMPPVAAAGPMDPAPENGPELGRFEPLAAFPHTTQAAVRSVLLGASWLTRMNQPHGRFQYGYLPALRQPMDGDHDLKQARAALALAQAARFTGDERQTAVAGQAILVLLAATRVDPADPGCRVPLAFSFTCNRLGFAALLASSIYAFPGSDEKLLAEAERLCGFLRKHGARVVQGAAQPTPLVLCDCERTAGREKKRDAGHAAWRMSRALALRRARSVRSVRRSSVASRVRSPVPSV